jgi:hypothetical protein
MESMSFGMKPSRKILMTPTRHPNSGHSEGQLMPLALEFCGVLGPLAGMNQCRSATDPWIWRYNFITETNSALTVLKFFGIKQQISFRSSGHQNQVYLHRNKIAETEYSEEPID